MDNASCQRLAEMGKRATVSHIDERTLHIRLANTALFEPARIEFARKLGQSTLFVIDLRQGFMNVRVGSKPREYFHECTKATARRVENSVDALRIIPPVAESSVDSDACPVGPSPGIGAASNPVERPVGRDDAELGCTFSAFFSHR